MYLPEAHLIMQRFLPANFKLLVFAFNSTNVVGLSDKGLSCIAGNNSSQTNFITKSILFVPEVTATTASNSGRQYKIAPLPHLLDKHYADIAKIENHTLDSNRY